MNRGAVRTYWAEICMAGDIAFAKLYCREFCYKVGLCVTIDPTTYIYTGGAEEGFKIRLINYPKFESTENAIVDTAKELAELLRCKLYQDSYTIITPHYTFWYTTRD